MILHRIRLCPTVYITRGLILDVNMWMRAKGSLPVQPRGITLNVPPSKGCSGVHALTIHGDHLQTHIDRPRKSKCREVRPLRVLDEERVTRIEQDSGNAAPLGGTTIHHLWSVRNPNTEAMRPDPSVFPV